MKKIYLICLAIALAVNVQAIPSGVLREQEHRHDLIDHDVKLYVRGRDANVQTPEAIVVLGKLRVGILTEIGVYIESMNANIEWCERAETSADEYKQQVRWARQQALIVLNTP